MHDRRLDTVSITVSSAWRHRFHGVRAIRAEGARPRIEVPEKTMQTDDPTGFL
jgi:hypothetical protein